MSRALAIGIVAIIVLISIVWLFGLNQDANQNTNTPAQPGTTSQATSTGMPSVPSAEITYHNATADFIRVTAPLAGGEVLRTFTVSGEARGNWYFEASFPLEVLDADGNRLMQMPIQAQGEWMTTDFVPFSTQVTIPGNYTGGAILVLHRDNPSGLPENDARFEIPIVVQ